MKDVKEFNKNLLERLTAEGRQQLLPVCSGPASRLRSTRLGSCFLVRQWIHVHALVLEAFWKSSTHFLHARAIRFESGHYTAIPWYVAPACSVSVSLEELQEYWSFWEIDPRIISTVPCI